MKILSGWLQSFIVISVIVYLGLSCYIYYYDKQRIQTATPSILSSYENIKLLETLESTGCDYCHIPSTPLPFYSKLPIAKQLMEYDINLGYKAFDFTPIRNSLINGTPPDESDLSKLELVIEHNTMPPARYTSLHWSGFFKPEEKERILRWIKGERQKYYSLEKASEKTQHVPIQPNPLSLPEQKTRLP
ncbi:TPA: heme-binding domain-containing protein [Providencia alcalifaciens]|nr:heme-binding domain-containing protein [Providencia alcalifaciens]